MSQVSEEVENYLRLHLLTKISTRAVRLIFDKEFHPDCLEATIKKAHGKLYDLKKKRVINAAQWNLLFPGSGDPPPQSKSFDVILMIILIRNLADPTSSAAEYDRLPLSIDISCTADLARIKHYRNQLSHCEDGKIKSAFFTTVWEDISGAIKRLGGPDMDKECKELRTTHLDHSIVPWNIRLQIRLVLDKWQKNDVMHAFGNKNMGKQKFRLQILNYLDTFDVSYQRRLAHTVDNIYKDTVILQCCFVDDIQFIQWCCFHKVDINQGRENGESPLYISSEKGHTEVVKILLDNKAFINECTKDGVSPLYIACQNNHLDIVKLLLDNRADLNNCKNDGASPLFIACQEGYTDIVKLLLNQTADINICRDTGSSPLFIACQNNHSEIVNLLLYNKADIDKSKNDGATPLFIACREGHTDIVKLLLNGNADINICPDTALSPITIAYQNNHGDIVHLLKNIPKGHLKIVKPKPAKIDSMKNVHNSMINGRSCSIFDCFEMEGPSQKSTSGMKRRKFSRLKASRNTPGGNKGMLRKQVKQKKNSSHDKTLIQLIYHKLNQYIHVYNLQSLLNNTIDIDKPTFDYWWGSCSSVINFMCNNVCVWFFLYFLPWYCLFMFDL